MSAWEFGLHRRFIYKGDTRTHAGMTRAKSGSICIAIVLVLVSVSGGVIVLSERLVNPGSGGGRRG